MEKRFLTPPETISAIIADGRRVLAQSLGRTFVLSLLAGFYISFGAQLATVVTSDAAAHLGSGVARLLGGSVFSIGLMLVVVCGAELFTGNSLLASSVLDGEISLAKMLENWGVVIVGNLLGAVFFAWMMAETRLWESGAVGEQALKIATVKCNLPFWVAFIRGLLCNWLVCLAVFMATAARDIPGKTPRLLRADHDLCRQRFRAFRRQHVLHPQRPADQECFPRRRSVAHLGEFPPRQPHPGDSRQHRRRRPLRRLGLLVCA